MQNKDSLNFTLFLISEDWQQGGKSDVYLWGNGRYGQLAGMGTNLMIPTLAPSLLQTQQVATFSIQTETLALMLLFSNISFLIWVLHCHSGCVWTELYFPGPVQWDCTGYRRRTIWETGPGEFRWSLCPHYYLCFSRYIHPGPSIQVWAGLLLDTVTEFYSCHNVVPTQDRAKIFLI